MKFKEILQSCVDEIVGEILTKDLAQNSDYRRLKQEEKQLIEEVRQAIGNNLPDLLNNYNDILHQIALTELRFVYKCGLRHGIKFTDLLK